jgi:hypothetical protein
MAKHASVLIGFVVFCLLASATACGVNSKLANERVYRHAITNGYCQVPATNGWLWAKCEK